MARNGSGTYSLPAGNPVTTGSTISSSWGNTTLTDIASALSQSISQDGQTPVTANLPMGGNKHTGVGAATARDQYCTAGQAQDDTFDWLTSPSGTNTITATGPVGLAAYAAGQVFRFIAPGTNTSTATLNINGIGAEAVTKLGTTALAAGDILLNAVIEVVYDGTQFQIISVSLDPTLVALAGLATGANKIPYSTGTDAFSQLSLDTDGTLAADSDTSLASQKAVKTYADTKNVGTQVSPGTSGNVLTSNGSVWTSAAPSNSVAAWVNFDGTGTNGTNQTIRASLNVASVYKNGTGDYTITFTSALADAYYAAVGSCGTDGSHSNLLMQMFCQASGAAVAPTSGGFRLTTTVANGAIASIAYNMISVFR
jgi:hypothetical protein